MFYNLHVGPDIKLNQTLGDLIDRLTINQVKLNNLKSDTNSAELLKTQQMTYQSLYDNALSQILNSYLERHSLTGAEQLFVSDLGWLFNQVETASFIDFQSPSQPGSSYINYPEHWGGLKHTLTLIADLILDLTGRSPSLLITNQTDLNNQAQAVIDRLRNSLLGPKIESHEARIELSQYFFKALRDVIEYLRHRLMYVNTKLFKLEDKIRLSFVESYRYQGILGRHIARLNDQRHIYKKLLNTLSGQEVEVKRFKHDQDRL